MFRARSWLCVWSNKNKKINRNKIQKDKNKNKMKKQKMKTGRAFVGGTELIVWTNNTK